MNIVPGWWHWLKARKPAQSGRARKRLAQHRVLGLHLETLEGRASPTPTLGGVERPVAVAAAAEIAESLPPPLTNYPD